jgi:tol-pal system protein YbgF
MKPRMNLIGELNLFIDKARHFDRAGVLAAKILLFKLVVILFLLTNSLNVVAQRDSDSLEMRLGKVETILASKALLDLALQVKKLEEEVRSLRGQNENQTFAIEVSIAELKKGIESLSRRVDSMEFGHEVKVDQQVLKDLVVEEPALVDDRRGAINGGDESPVEEKVIETSQLTLDPNTMFKDAVNLLKTGDYAAAIHAFSTFYTLYPNNIFADDSLFRAAEACYLRRDFTDAIIAYQRLIKIFPKSSHRASAMLKLAYSYHELGDNKKALLMIKELKSLYPLSASAQLADERMSRIDNTD